MEAATVTASTLLQRFKPPCASTARFKRSFIADSFQPIFLSGQLPFSPIRAFRDLSICHEPTGNLLSGERLDGCLGNCFGVLVENTVAAVEMRGVVV